MHPRFTDTEILWGQRLTAALVFITGLAVGAMAWFGFA